MYSLPLAPDARVPFVNPFASVGPVGAPHSITVAAFSGPCAESTSAYMRGHARWWSKT